MNNMKIEKKRAQKCFFEDEVKHQLAMKIEHTTTEKYEQFDFNEHTQLEVTG